MKQGKSSFYLLATSLFISSIGGSVLRFAISLHVLDLTGSAAIFATMIGISNIPLIVLTPLGGAIADRISKKLIIVFCDTGKAIAVTALALILFSSNVSVVIFGIVITLFSTIQACYSPAVITSVPLILEKDRLVKANGIMQAIQAASGMAGPVIGGFMFGALGINFLTVFCAALFVFSAVINIFIKIPHQKREIIGSFVKTVFVDMKEGFVYVAKTNRLLLRAGLTFAFVIFFFQSMIAVASPYIMRVTLSMAEEPIGFVNATFGVSMLVASLLAGLFKKYMEIRHLAYYIIIIGLSAIPVAFATFVEPSGFAPVLLLAGGFVLTLFVFTLTNVMIITYVQTTVPKELMGKVIAMLTTVANSATPLGVITLGMLIEELADVQFVLYLGIAAFTVLLGLVSISRLKKV
jgi:MFS family permease